MLTLSLKHTDSCIMRWLTAKIDFSLWLHINSPSNTRISSKSSWYCVEVGMDGARLFLIMEVAMKVGNLQRAHLGFLTLESDGKIQLSLWLSLLQGLLTLTTRSQWREWMMPWLLGKSTPTSGSSVRTVGPHLMTHLASPTSTTPMTTWPRTSTQGWSDLYLSVRKVRAVTPDSTTAKTLEYLGDCTGVRLREPWNLFVGDAGEGSGDQIMNEEKYHLVPTFRFF